MKLYTFRTVRLSIIRSLFTVHLAMVYVIHVCRQLSSRTIRSCSKAVYKPLWNIPLLSVQWTNSWWWTDELSETWRVSCQNKFVKLVHLFGFITKDISDTSLQRLNINFINHWILTWGALNDVHPYNLLHWDLVSRQYFQFLSTFCKSPISPWLQVACFLLASHQYAVL